MSKIKVHFVCLGNAYRSRLAEAYAKSLNLKDFEFSSSGIAAHLFEQRLPQHTKIPAKFYHLGPFMAKGQEQTTEQLLAKQDLIIFLKADVLAEAKKMYEFDERKTLVWNIDDMWQALRKKRIKDANSERAYKLALETFQKIKRDVDRLAVQIARGKWIDIYDKTNRPLGFKLPIDLANKKGLWHRSVHVLVLTSSGQFVVEKRSAQIIMAPNLLDISLGGYVDAGEEPLQAARREVGEELGVEVPLAQLKLLQVTKSASYHPKYKRATKGFTYSYVLKLKPDQENFKLQTKEVAAIYLLWPRRANQLARLHHLHPFGRLNYPYKLYKTDLELAERHL